MGIARIRKIEVLGLQKDKAEVMTLLQRLGVIELIPEKENTPAVAHAAHIAEVEEAISFLRSFQPKPGLLEGIIKLRPLVYESELNEFIGRFDYARFIAQLEELRTKLKRLLQDKERLAQERQLLKPWQLLTIPLDRLQESRSCGVILGVLKREKLQEFLQQCDAEKLRAWCQPLCADNANASLFILYLKDDFERLEAVLKALHFNFVTLPRHKGTARERTAEIDREISLLDGQVARVSAEIAQHAPEQFKLMVVYDYLANVHKRDEVIQGVAAQRYTFLLRGWIRRKDIALLERALSERYPAVALFISRPAAGDDIPTALENPALIQPFEAVTNLYGQPAYAGLDPTRFLAPFFALSFGFCLLDAGYGLVLALVILFFLRQKQISPYGKNFLRLFLFASFATIFAGIITGSFFGDLISRLPGSLGALKALQKRLVLFDPVKDSLLFLGLTLALGFMQILTGVCIKFFRDLRSDKFTAFVLDLPTLLVQTGLLLLVLVASGALPAALLKFVLALLITASCGVIFYQWTANREISLRIFWSVFGIYSIATGNFLADTLSFSRIFALGLTGGLLGMALNTMLLPSGPVQGVSGFLGLAAASLALCAGHLINLAISILGAYVHTSRLQYLEFFTKFFESGGRQFKPFKLENKYVFLSDNNS